MSGEAKEKCAVVGVLSANSEVDAATIAYVALGTMQHRGKDASGIASINSNGDFRLQRNNGVVESVFDDGDLLGSLSGPIAVGHNKYTTQGKKDRHLQPIYDYFLRSAFSHNGNLPDTTELETIATRSNAHIDSMNDSELAAFAINQQIRSGKELPDAVEAIYPKLIGAFSCAMMQDNALVAFRDKCGIRPLALGRIKDGFMVASEDIALKKAGAEYMREVNPGEMVIITKGGLESRQLTEPNPKLDIFEDIYFARPDSKLHGQTVSKTRHNLGRQLAEEHALTAEELGGKTVVVGAPESGIPIGIGYADAVDLPYVPALVKERPERSFMANTHVDRLQVIEEKITVIPEYVDGKNVILVDDSIVRGNTVPGLKDLIMGAGAKSLSVLVGSPPIQFPDFYGIDTPKQKDLIAANLTIEQIRQTWGIRYLGYLSLQGMIKATRQPENIFNLSCFTGQYPIDIGQENWNKIKPPITSIE